MQLIVLIRMTINVYLNLWGLESKRKSLEIILNKISPQSITCLSRSQNQNFISFNRNRSKQIMGSVATFVDRNNKDNFVRMSEGENNDNILCSSAQPRRRVAMAEEERMRKGEAFYAAHIRGRSRWQGT